MRCFSSRPKRLVGLRPWLFAGFVLVVLALSAGTAAAAPVSPVGTWKSVAHCTIGWCKGQDFNDPTTITRFNSQTGSFSGTDAGMVAQGTMSGSSMHMVVSSGGYSSKVVGSIAGNNLQGTWSDSNGAGGAWTGTRIAGGPAVAPASAGNPEVGSIAGSLVTPSKAFTPISSDVVNAVITVGLALFLTFPANMFNSTFEENYADIAAWGQKWAALLFPLPLRRAVKSAYTRAKTWTVGRVGLAGRSEHKKLEREQLGFVGVLLVGSLLGALLDPSFGANFRTILSFVAIVIAMVAGVTLSALITVGYHRARSHGKVPYKLEALPAGLLIAAACVLISRASGFAPGYLYGVICGVSFARELAKQEEGHVVALGAVVKVFLAIVAWVAWAALTHDASKPGSFFGTVLLDDFLATLFVSSLVGTVISLFPLRFLPGHKLQQWHKGVWAATFGLCLFVLVQVLLRPHSTSKGPSHTPLVTTIALFVLFAAGSVLFREHFARKRRAEEARTAAAGTDDGVIALSEGGAAASVAPGESVVVAVVNPVTTAVPPSAEVATD